jgi:hypothetical protein
MNPFKFGTVVSDDYFTNREVICHFGDSAPRRTILLKKSKKQKVSSRKKVVSLQLLNDTCIWT